MENKYNKYQEYRNKNISEGKIKKHIIIAGVPRTGKTTISSLIAKTGKYQHLCMDAIIGAFEKEFPETGVTTYTENPDSMVIDVSGKIVKFINDIISANNYDKCDYKLIIDILELTPHDYVHYIDKRFADIYFFGTPDLTASQIYDNIKKYDTSDDYTFYITDKDLMKRCKRFHDLSIYLEKECKKYNLPFINTSYNREEQINTLVEKILKK